MAIDIVDLTDVEARRVVASKESHFLEAKSKLVQPAKFTKAISALANADGGEVFVGLDQRPDKSLQWNGFRLVEDANDHLQTFEKLFPLGSEFQYAFYKCATQPGFVLYVNVAKTRSIVKASDGYAYRRRGAQSLPCITPDEQKRLELDKGIVSFEDETVNMSLDALATSPVLEDFIKTQVPKQTPAQWLNKQLLVHGGKPVVAGTLLYAEEPQAALPKRCAIKIYRYKTTEREGSRDTLAFNPLTIEGCVYALIKRAVDETVDILSDIEIRGPRGPEKARYPKEALHEVITNAVLHRDYSIADDIDIRIFDNRVEVESPGNLPGHVTIDNILKTQFARNPRVVRLINKFPNPPNKDVGEGLNTAFEAMRKFKLRDPKIVQGENAVIVLLPHEELASPDVMILEYLRNHPEINRSKAMEITHVPSESKVQKIIRKLRDQGLVESTGKQGRAAAYRLTPRGRELYDKPEPGVIHTIIIGPARRWKPRQRKKWRR